MVLFVPISMFEGRRVSGGIQLSEEQKDFLG